MFIDDHPELLPGLRREEITLVPVCTRGALTNIQPEDGLADAFPAAQQAVAEEPLKDVSAYKAEVAGYVKSSKQYLESAEKQIQRGKLKNGMQYALYPSSTRDDKTYVTISIDFGTAESLFNKAELLDKIKGTISKIDVALDGGSILSDVTENLDGSGIVKKESNLKIGDAIEMALSAESNTDKGKRQAMKVKAAKKRKDMVEAKRSLGMVGNKKQSKFSTRSDHFLGDKLEAVQIILNNKQTGIYNDGADFCPRLLMGHPAYGNACKKNAFEHLVNLQKKICEFKGDNPKEAPDWIILCNDTSLIADRNLIPRLKELLPTTGAAAAYGFEKIRASGRWYEMTEQDQSFVRGCYIQANTTDTNWDFIVGNQFKQSPRYRIFY
jgi:hypothetical protein